MHWFKGGRLRTAKVAVAAAVTIGTLIGGPQAALASHRVINYLVLARDFRFIGVPSALPTADYDTRFINLGQAPHVVVAVNLGPECQGLSKSEAIALFDLGEEEVFEACPGAAVNGEAFALPGSTAHGTLTVTEGQNWFVCFVNAHYRLGMLNSVRGIAIG